MSELRQRMNAMAPDHLPPIACQAINTVAGFGEGDLDITQERNVLVIKGGKAEELQGEYLHRGIAGRSFERKFELADHVRVEGADLRHGLLTVALKREVPEAPRKIEIGFASSNEPLRLETDRQVA